MSERQLKRVANKTLELQEDESDCGVAALLSILQYYSSYVSLEELRLLSGTTTVGTTMLGLIQAANKVGLTAEAFEGNNEELKKLSSPTILHVTKYEVLEHYVVCYGYFNEHFIIGDPEDGVKLLTESELNDIWLSHALITFSPSDHLAKKNKTTERKYKWIKEVIKADKSLVISTIILGIVITLLSFSTAIFTEKLVDNLLPSKDPTRIISGLVAWFLLIGVKVFFSYIRELILLRQSFSFNSKLIGDFISRLIHLPKSFFDSRKTGDLISRLFDTERIQRSVAIIISQDVIDIITLILSIVFVSFYHVNIAIFLVVLIPLYFAIVRNYYAVIYKSNKQVMASFARNESTYIDNLTGIESIKQLNRSTSVIKKLQYLFDQYQHEVVKVGRVELSFKLTNDFFGVLSVFFILSYCVLNVVNGNLEVGDMLAIFGIASISLASTNKLAFAITHLQEAKAALDRTFDIISQKGEKQDGEVITGAEKINFDSVSFGFPGRTPLLNEISFSVSKGVIVSIIGENGSGKSTILQLVQSFYKPEAGNIFIDELEIQNIDTKSLRKLIGVVPQESKIFNSSLSYNISLDELADEDEMRQFLEKYHLVEFFNAFPQGLQTILGEEGVKASGGQKQMIGLARALYQNPSFLLLDEFTSAMDKKAEAMALSLVKKLSKKMGVLIISHDPKISTIADVEYELSNKVLGLTRGD